MCGLFGYVGEAADPVVLAGAALEASARGPHGWGVASANGHGLDVERFVGELDGPAADALARRRGLVVGHARMVTSGDRWAVDEYQPVVAGPVALAHNGVVPGAGDTAQLRGITPPTPVDSAALAALIAAAGGPHWTMAVERALVAVEPPGATALILLVPGEGVATARRRGADGRSGHPLWYLRRREGTYFCSRRPGELWEPHPDDAVLWWDA